MVVVRGAIGKVEFELTVPKGMTAKTASLDPKSDRVSVTAGSVVWQLDDGDSLSFEVTHGTATPIQNAVNLEASESRRTSRTDASADGWIVTSHDPDAKT